MSNEKLKVGDIVRLKSGGPPMTIEVVATEGGLVIAAWFVHQERRNEKFQAEALEVCEPDNSSDE